MEQAAVNYLCGGEQEEGSKKTEEHTASLAAAEALSEQLRQMVEAERSLRAIELERAVEAKVSFK